MRVAAFDSGVGGLTAIAPLLRHHPQLSVTYLGDLANLPYGSKSPRRIRELTHRNISWLVEHTEKPDLVLIACNTASAQAMDVAQEYCAQNSLPCLGVLEPGARFAIHRQPARIVVLATSATVKSEAYPQALRRLGYAGEILQKACPLFVPLVEDHLYRGPGMAWIARHYLDSVLKAGDEVILGCTHYPFLRQSLAELYPECHWIEAGEALLQENIFRAQKDAAAGLPPLAKRLKIFLSDPSANVDSLENFLKILQLQPIADAPQTVRIEI